MKSLIAAVGALALMAGVGSSEAHAENFFSKIGKSLRNAHERHVEILEEVARDSRDHDRDNRGYDRDDRGRDRDDRGHDRDDRRGHFETVESQVWVAGYEKTEYVEVREAGHYEFQQVTEIVTPASCEKIYVQPVFRTERDRCGNEVRIMVRNGYWTTREIPAVTCTKSIRVWVEGECKQVAQTVCIPGHYETKCQQVWVRD